MTILSNLSVLALRQLIDGACRSIGPLVAAELTERVTQTVTRHFTDNSQKLTRALESANGRAWQVLEISLAGDSFWERCRLLLRSADERAFRQQVQALLAAAPVPGADQAEFRQECLRQLRVARKAGVLASGSLDPQALAKRAGEFARFSDPMGLLQVERQVIGEIAGDLAGAGYGGIAQYVSIETDAGTTLIASAVRFFFRRHVETDRELFQGLTFAQLEKVQHEQEAGFAVLADLFQQHGERVEALLVDVRDVVVETRGDVLDLKAELQKQTQQLQELGQAVAKALDQHRLPSRELRPGDSLSMASDGERQLVRSLAARFRAMPEEERRRLPALLNSLGLLEAAAGEFHAAQRDFREVAGLVADPAAQAAALHNAYLAALEQAQWVEALAALQQAVTLAPDLFTPFPAKYEPVRILGAGGFGVAFLCKHRNTGSQVVVKALRTDGLDRSVGDLFREAQVLEELDHPAIIRLRDCDFAGAGRSRPFLVMEYFDGRTLADHVHEHGPLPPADLLGVARPVAEALQAAHDRGILHRDVKPANLLVRKEPAGWRVKLIDFGLALKRSLLQSTATGKSVIGASVAGTREFAAPEQMGLLPGVAAGPAADIYGFAKTCCFALFKTVQPLRKHWNAVPAPLADLLEHCLAEAPAERPGSFAVVLEKLGGESRPAPPPVEKPAPPAEKPAPPPIQLAGPARQPSLPLRPHGLKPGLIHCFQGHTMGVTCVAFSPDGRWAVSGGREGAVRLWDLQTKKEGPSHKHHTKPVGSVAFFPDGLRVISASADNTVRVFDLAAGKVRSFDRQTCWAVALSPDGKLALSGSGGGTVHLWNVQTGAEVRGLRGHTEAVRGLAFSPDGRRALSSSRDQTVRLWDLESGRQLLSFTVPKVWLTTIGFTPDGRQAVTGNGHHVSFWDLATGQETRPVEGHNEDVLAVALSADGRRVLYGGVGGTVRLWDLEARKELAWYAGHQGEVSAVAVHGNLALSGGEDRTVRYWALPE